MAGDKIGLRLERFPGFRQMNRIPVVVQHRLECIKRAYTPPRRSAR
jgi:hypothetical protein